MSFLNSETTSCCGPTYIVDNECNNSKFYSKIKSRSYFLALMNAWSPIHLRQNSFMLQSLDTGR